MKITRFYGLPLIVVTAMFCHSECWAGDLNDGLKAYMRGDYKTAYTLLSPLAEQGNSIAAGDLGLLYYRGQGVEKDDKEAFKWLSKSAETGLALSQFMVGMMYLKGEGVSKNSQEAFTWFKRTAETTSDPIYNFGVSASNHKTSAHSRASVESALNRPDARARALQSQSQDNENLNARVEYVLGTMYMQADGVEKNPELAYDCFLKAAHQGNSGAEYDLGLMYEIGARGPKDLVQAYAWYQLAAAQNNEKAIAHLQHIESSMTSEQIEEAKKVTPE